MHLIFLLFALLTAHSGASLPFDLLDYAFEFQRDEEGCGELSQVLGDYHGQEVTVSGFLYPLDHQRCVLAAEPELPSCCVGSGGKMSSQLVISGLPDPVETQKAVTITGKFFVDMKQGEDGAICQVYRLDDARLVPRSRTSPWITLAGGVVVACGAAGYAVSKRNRSRPTARQA